MTAILIAIATSLIASVIWSEIGAWSPHLIRLLIRAAICVLPIDLRERFEEEWSAHVNDTPGGVGKFLVALGILFAALQIGPLAHIKYVVASWGLVDRALALLGLVFVAPLLLILWCIVSLLTKKDAFVRSAIMGENGRIIWALKLRSPAGVLGAFFQRSALDELPMLANVVKGDLAFPKLVVPWFRRPDDDVRVHWRTVWHALRRSLRRGPKRK